MICRSGLFGRRLFPNAPMEPLLTLRRFRNGSSNTGSSLGSLAGKNFLPRLNPVALAFKWVGWERNTARLVSGMERIPVNRHARDPELSGGVEQEHRIGDLFLRVPHGSDDLGAFRLTRVLAGQRSERLAGTNLQKYPRRVAEQFGEPVGEAHGTPQVLGPIAWIGGFRSRDPRAGDVRKIRNLGRAQRNFGEMSAERLKHWVHHRGMECMRGVQQAAGNCLFLELQCEFLNGIGGAR